MYNRVKINDHSIIQLSVSLSVSLPIVMYKKNELVIYDFIIKKYTIFSKKDILLVL